MSATAHLPYGAFNFLVDLGAGVSTESPDAGFEQCGPFAEQIDVVEYRNGNDAQLAPHKLTGMSRPEDVTFRRGVIGTATLYEWFDQARSGNAAAVRAVTVTLMSDDRSAQVTVWKLINARPVRYAAGPLDARGGVVAIEELTVAYERLEMNIPPGG